MRTNEWDKYVRPRLVYLRQTLISDRQALIGKKQSPNGDMIEFISIRS